MIRKTFPALLCFLISGAVAEANYACAVKRSSDGFVALRDGPSAKHSLVARMKPQELVGLLHPPDYTDIVQEGNWVLARWYPGTKRTAMHVPEMDESKSRSGWVNKRLIDCFE